MKLIPIVILAVLVIAPASGATTPSVPSSIAPKGMATALKKYKATVTRKDARGNTKTFTDYCEATGYFEAQKTFEGRYPDATISGITEVK
jgi:hypothetical protein